MPLALSYLFKIVLTIWVFHGSLYIRIISSNFVKNVTGILIGIILNLLIGMGRVAILTLLILPIEEHEMSFHFFESSSISFTDVL